MLSYGRVITAVAYDDDSTEVTEKVIRAKTVINTVVRTEESVPLSNLQQLWDNLIQQVGRLQTEDAITLTIECDRISREPNRMIVNSKHSLQ